MYQLEGSKAGQGNSARKQTYQNNDLGAWLANNGPQRIDKIQLLTRKIYGFLQQIFKDEINWLKKIPKSFWLIDFYKQNCVGCPMIRQTL